MTEQVDAHNWKAELTHRMLVALTLGLSHNSAERRLPPEAYEYFHSTSGCRNADMITVEYVGRPSLRPV